MLFNPQWNAPTLHGFISWLGQQTPDTEYLYDSCNACAIGQYAESLGLHYINILEQTDITDWNNIIARPLPRTFGAAYQRALVNYG
jgi:hypothetical protein